VDVHIWDCSVCVYVVNIMTGCLCLISFVIFSHDWLISILAAVVFDWQLQQSPKNRSRKQTLTLRYVDQRCSRWHYDAWSVIVAMSHCHKKQTTNKLTCKTWSFCELMGLRSLFGLVTPGRLLCHWARHLWSTVMPSLCYRFKSVILRFKTLTLSASARVKNSSNLL